MSKKNKRTITKEIKHTLEESDKMKYGKYLAEKIAERDQITLEKKESMSEFKSRLDNVMTDINGFSEALNSGFEMREVKCEVFFNLPSPGKKTIVRMDTGEEIGIESMTEEEKQEELPFNDED
jgi:hypothetical protein